MSKTDLNVIDRIIDVARGVTVAHTADQENRATRRVDYDAPMALVQMTPDGGKSIPTIVQGKNISAGGMCIYSRYMLHVGYEGAVLMLRSNGEPVILGVKVVYCKYVGDMQHESGIEFIDPTAVFMMKDFCDEQGNMIRLESSRAA